MPQNELEAVNTNHALILTLISQKLTEIDVCKSILSAPSVCHLDNQIFHSSFSFSHTQHLFLFFLGHIFVKNNNQQK